MPNFDRTIDSRWRPDFESSQKRVRQENAEETESARETALIPPDHAKAFDAHDPQTAALMRRLEALERRPHGEMVTKLIGEWDWIEKMMGYEEKQRFLEPLICAVQRRPEENEGLLIFLMLVFEPVRRSVSKAFINARSGLHPQPQDMNWTNRAEARMIQHVERQDLFDVTREAALEALYKFPTPPRITSSGGCARRLRTGRRTNCAAICRRSRHRCVRPPRPRRSSSHSPAWRTSRVRR